MWFVKLIKSLILSSNTHELSLDSHFYVVPGFLADCLGGDFLDVVFPKLS